MDKIAALIHNGYVTNRIVVPVDENGESDFAMDDHEIVILPDDSPVGIGWTHENGEFIEPVVEEFEAVLPSTPTE